MIKDQILLVPNKDRDPWREGGAFRPDDWMQNPYIGKDGKDYHSTEALNDANRSLLKVNFPENLKKLHKN